MWNKKVELAWNDWMELDDWNVFATLNFGRLHLLEGNKIDAAGKIWRSCLATIDRSLYGKTHGRQRRFNRVAFKHYGGAGTTPHLHMLVKSPINAPDFCVYLNAIWATKFDVAGTPATNSITPLISTKGATGYGLREEHKIDTGSFDERLSYINTGAEHLVRTDALDRLKSYTTPTKLIQANLALPMHIETTVKNYERREGRRAAALLRS